MCPMTLFYVAHEFNPVHPPLPQLLFSLAKCCPAVHNARLEFVPLSIECPILSK
ncbi:hypothetical protein Plhal703r1_c63g0167241 [Plasmopara halstedii]